MAAMSPPLSPSDVEGAGILLTSVLSIIFYARSAFPADCFQMVLDSQLRDPNVTHATLISLKKPLLSSDGTRDAILADGGPSLYLTKSSNPRMARFLDTLNKIFSFLQHRRLGKVQFCLGNSKTWDRDSLIEFYSLKLSYTDLGSVHIYLDWGGDAAVNETVNNNQSLRAFLRNRPTLEQPFYIHPFLYSIDGRSLSGQNGAGFGQHVKEAVSLLQTRKGTHVGRIQKFIYHSPADSAAGLALKEAENREKENVRKRKEGVLEIVKSLSFQRNSKHLQAENSHSQSFKVNQGAADLLQQSQATILYSTPPEYELPRWINGEEDLHRFASPSPTASTQESPTAMGSNFSHSNWLMADERDEDQMPPTQAPGDPTGLPESQISDRRHEMASPLPPPSSYQSIYTNTRGQF